MSLNHHEGEGLRPLPVSSETVPLFCNVPDAQLFAQVQSAVDRDLPILTRQEANDGTAVIVGGGPSVSNFIPELTARKKNGHAIFALNGAGRWLVDHGIDPDALILLDARPENVRFLFGIPKTTKLYLASQCHPCVFDAAEGFDVVMWHPNYDGKSGVKEHRNTVLIGGGTSVGMRSLSLVHTLGFRRLHLYGYDSSYADTEGHAYEQLQGEQLERVTLDGRDFFAPPWMVRQACDFQPIANDLSSKGSQITVHGDGLLPTVAKLMSEDLPGHAVYDLGEQPSSWDFVHWLALADMDRRQAGITEPLKVSFIPGPNNGFRNDDLPQAIESRKAIFENVIKPAVSLIGGEIVEGTGRRYPYMMRPVVEAYKAGLDVPRFTPKPSDIRAVDRFLAGCRPIVITLREASHWPSRNSNLDAWLKFAQWVDEPVVFVRDTEKANDPLPFQTYPEASRDIGIRCALYERAQANLMVMNGPIGLCIYGRAPFIAFKPFVDDYTAGTPEWWVENIGVAPGGNYPWALPGQKIAWCDDTFENIKSAWADLSS